MLFFIVLPMPSIACEYPKGEKTQCSVLDDVFPPPHNVTVSIDGHDLLFVGDDLNERINSVPEVLENESARQEIEKHADSFLFLDKGPWSKYVILVGLNETHYVEILLEFSQQGADLGALQSFEVIADMQLYNSLMAALHELVILNSTMRLNLSSSCFTPYLWSYNYTADSFAIPLGSLGTIIWQHGDHENLLSQYHWEIVAWMHTECITYMPDGDPEHWESGLVWLMATLSFTLDGELIQIRRMAPPPAGSSGALSIYLCYILGLGAAGCIVVIVLFWRRRCA